MQAEQPPTSPFASGVEGRGVEENLSPEAQPPYDSRLGIVHLLVWTACTAMVLGIDRSFLARVPWGANSTATLLISGFNSLGSGACLGGVLLWAWRRHRGETFPRYPGEYLVIALGLVAVLNTLTEAVFCLLVPQEAVGAAQWASWMSPWTCFHALTTLIAYAMLAKRMVTTRWRVAFCVCLGTTILRALMPCAGLHSIYSHYALSILPDSAVGLAIWGDWRRGLPRPWTHWLGVAAFYWGTITIVTWMVVRYFSGN